MSKKGTYTIGGGLFILVGVLIYLFIGTGKDSNSDEITDFDSCARHYPIIQSYSELCKTPDGQTFAKQY